MGEAWREEVGKLESQEDGKRSIADGRIQGTMGNVTFFKLEEGFLLKPKSELAKSRIMSDPRFERTRENMSEFGNTCRGGNSVCTPFTALLKKCSDGKMVSRLTNVMMNIVHSDTASARGNRSVQNGDLSLLKGFDFNSERIFKTTFFAAYTVTFNKNPGVVALNVPAFVPEAGIAAPNGATHFQLVLSAAPVDFEQEQEPAPLVLSAILPWDNSLTAPVSPSLSLPAASTLPVLTVLKI